MVTKEDILNYLIEKKPDFEKEFKVIKVGLFGSYALGTQTEKSDIDILIEFKTGTEDLYEKKEKIRFLIKSRFDKDVDLAREKYLKPYYKKQILQSAIYA